MAAAATISSNHIPLVPASPSLHQRASPIASLAKPQLPQPPTSPAKKAPLARGRRERPCDACRRRKSRCVTTEGSKSCSACGAHGQPCTYIEDPLPRKRKAESQEKTGHQTKRKASFSTSSTISSSTANLHTDGRQSAQASAKSVSKIRLDKLAARSLAPAHVSYLGPATELEPCLLDFRAQTANLGVDFHNVDGRSGICISQNAGQRQEHARMAALDSIDKLPGLSDPNVVQSIWQWTCPYLPILGIAAHEAILSKNFSDIDPTIFLVLYLLALPQLAEQFGPQFGHQSYVPGLEELISRLFADSLASPTLTTVQLSLLLMQQPHVDSKRLHLQAIAAATEIGLHVDDSAWPISDVEKSMRRRVAWALYVQDKWCSLMHGQPCMVSKNDWALLSLADQDLDLDDDLVNSPQTKERIDETFAIFRHTISLAEIQASVLDTFYSPKAMTEVDVAGPAGTRHILERAKPVQLQLKEWFASIPSELKMDNANAAERSAAVASLHLSYLNTELTLHRQILRSLSSPQTSNAPYLSHIIRSAAKTRLISSLDYVNRLRPSHLCLSSRSAWSFTTSFCFKLIGAFGGLLLVTSSCTEEAAFYRKRLEELQWTLGADGRWGDELVGAAERSVQEVLSDVGDWETKLPPAEDLVDGTLRDERDSAIDDESPTASGVEKNPSMEETRKHRGNEEEARDAEGDVRGVPVSPSTSTSSGSTTYRMHIGALSQEAE